MELPNDLRHLNTERDAFQMLDEADAGTLLGIVCASVCIFWIIPEAVRAISRYFA